MTKRNVPELRLAGFEGEWKRKTVKQVAPLQRGFDLPNSKLKTGDVPVVMSNGIENYHSTPKVQGPGVVTGRSGTIGKLQYIDRDYWPHNTTLWVTNFHNNNPRFIYFLFESIKLEKFASGSGVPTLNRNDVHDSSVTIPPALAEQEAIGAVFSDLDAVIEKHEQKHRALQQTKSALMQRMFPQEGETQPRLRLEGFEGEWVETTVQAVATRHDNDRVPITKKDRIAGSTPYYGANGIQDYVTGFTHVGPMILIAEDGANNLDEYPVEYVTGHAWVNNHAHVLKSLSGKADDKFLKTALTRADIKSLLVGGGRAKLNASQLMQIVLSYPSLAEQEAIGAVFSKLDGLITAEAKLVEKLKQAKTALLQKMFV